MRLIDTDALKKAVRDLDLDNSPYWLVVKAINDATTVDITEEQAIDKLHETGWMQRHDKEMTERPTGEWYYSCQNGWHCSICQQIVKDMPTVMGKAHFDYCPNCGARMEEENDSDS